MGKRKQRHAMTWVPDTRPKADNPDPNAAMMLDIELAARFRQLVDLAETDPHLPGRLREAVEALKDEVRAELCGSCRYDED